MSRYHAAATASGQNGRREEISAEVAGHFQLVETFTKTVHIREDDCSKLFCSS